MDSVIKVVTNSVLWKIVGEYKRWREYRGYLTLVKKNVKIMGK